MASRSATIGIVLTAIALFVIVVVTFALTDNIATIAPVVAICGIACAAIVIWIIKQKKGDARNSARVYVMTSHNTNADRAGNTPRAEKIEDSEDEDQSVTPDEIIIESQ